MNSPETHEAFFGPDQIPLTVSTSHGQVRAYSDANANPPAHHKSSCTSQVLQPQLASNYVSIKASISPVNVTGRLHSTPLYRRLGWNRTETETPRRAGRAFTWVELCGRYFCEGSGLQLCTYCVYVDPAPLRVQGYINNHTRPDVSGKMG